MYDRSHDTCGGSGSPDNRSEVDMIISGNNVGPFCTKRIADLNKGLTWEDDEGETHPVEFEEQYCVVHKTVHRDI